MSYALLFEVGTTERGAIQFLQRHHCLRQAPNCHRPGCGRSMSLVDDGSGHGRLIWRCATHKGEKIPTKANSYWHNSMVPLHKHMQILFNWSHKIGGVKTVDQTGVGEKTVYEWFGWYRDVCSTWLLNNPYKIGGIGVVVQVDESVVAYRKNHVGRVIPQKWVFGGYCKDQGIGFFEYVERRDAATLLPLIRKYVHPGSIICSDLWASYQQVANIPVNPPYQHGTVNHSQNFVDPVTGVHTNAVEAYWSRMKARLKEYHGVPASTLASHLDEFMWMDLHGKSGGRQTMETLLLHLSQWRPVP